MANLFNNNIGLNYRGILNLEDLNGPISSTLKAIHDGAGGILPIKVSTTECRFTQAVSFVAGSGILSFAYPSITGTKTVTFPNADGTVSYGTGSANLLAYWVDANTLGSLATSTYPSLTELSYVKGVTSAIQTQLNSKIGLTSLSATTPVTYNNLTGVISILQSGIASDGYLSSIDWNIFNNKQNALGFTPVTNARTLTINGVTYDLTANRTWSVGTVLGVTASLPLSSTGGANPNISISQASASSDGYLSSTDWSTFNLKEPAITILPISKGGTNSGTALSNNRVMQSSGGAIVEAAAITPARALKSDANGIPTHFDTATEPSVTELTYVKGVTSAIQTQLNAKASTTQTDYVGGLIEAPSNKDYKLIVKMPVGGTITETTTICVSGTATATFKINTTALGGTVNSVSSVEQSQAHASSNTFVAGDDIVLTISANSSCTDMSFTIKYTTTLS